LVDLDCIPATFLEGGKWKQTVVKKRKGQVKIQIVFLPSYTTSQIGLKRVLFVLTRPMYLLARCSNLTKKWKFYKQMRLHYCLNEIEKTFHILEIWRGTVASRSSSLPEMSWIFSKLPSLSKRYLLQFWAAIIPDE